ncbi:SHOCT domain-containing protein [Bacillus thuringiensis]
MKKEKVEERLATNATISVADELKKFKELLDMGVITEDEFNAKKKQLLNI